MPNKLFTASIPETTYVTKRKIQVGMLYEYFTGYKTLELENQWR